MGKNKLEQKKIKNNIDEILAENNYKLIGIRSLFHNNSKIYISLLFKSAQGYSMNIYVADLNYEKLNFELFFLQIILQTIITYILLEESLNSKIINLY